MADTTKKYLDKDGLLYVKQKLDSTFVKKVAGKDLSTNDYTTAEKNKLAGLENYELPKATTSTLGGIIVGTNLSIDANGTLSADAQHIDVDSSLSTSSENPVQNKVVTGAINNKVDKEAGKGLSTNDLTDELKQTYDETVETVASLVAEGGEPNVIEGVSVNGTAAPITNKIAEITMPTKVSDLTNDTGFITKAVNDLTNYYTSSNTYTKTEVDNLVSAIPKFAIEVVSTLPTTNISTTTVYLVTTGSESQNLYTEYIYVNSKWEKLGTQTVDLSGYYTSTQVDNLLDDKADSADLAAVATSGDYTDLTNTPTIDTAMSNSSTNAVQNKVVYTALEAKVNETDLVAITNAEIDTIWATN